MNDLHPETFDGFCSYVLDFYGPSGSLPMGASRQQVEHAVHSLLRLLNTRGEEFRGDSLDRESTRDLLSAMYGLALPTPGGKADG